MQYPSWHSSRQRFVYRRRVPEQSNLYRIVYHYREQFEYTYEQLFQQRYGILRDEVLNAFDKYLNCGILRHGCARAHCERCNHSQLIAFSCKRRGICPSCQAKRAVLFAENLHENILLPQPHRHLIFSLPKRLRVYFRYDRRLFTQLYRAAWMSWCQYVEQHLPDGTPASVLALHTAGDTLNWHPHIHAVALDGVIADSGEFAQLPTVDANILQELFIEHVFEFLLKQELISDKLIQPMLAQEHTGFNVYTTEPIAGSDADARLFLARYLKKPPLAESRLGIDDTRLEPTICITKESDDGNHITRELSPLEFLAELSCHIPNTWEQTTRFFGAYSCRSRGAVRRDKQFKEIVESNFLCEELPEKRPGSVGWARCIKKVFEVDPLVCPKCGETMKIVSFLHSPSEIERIAKNLGYNTWRAPPKFTSNPSNWLDQDIRFNQLTE